MQRPFLTRLKSRTAYSVCNMRRLTAHWGINVFNKNLSRDILRL
jgi:hypothetical protein